MGLMWAPRGRGALNSHFPWCRNMSSLVSRDTMSLVRELGRKGELVPADSLASTLHLRPFCLVRKKHRRPRWPWDTPFVPTAFSLVDALEPGSPIPGNKTLRPSFLQELQSRKEKESLYMVTEALEATQQATFQRRAEGAGQLTLLQLGHLQGQSTVATEKTVGIPQGAVLAYRVLQLVMKEDRWALSATRHCLLAQCLEREVLPQQLELCEHAALTRSLVESCGLELRGPGHGVTWDPGAVPQLSALYASLAGLQLLAEPSPAAPQADA
ncbi:unnamed protein product [Rangifer tarandus platyrhynchus]|uniref:Gasdermin pore forming domain-containing protein n=2 Tax=Rangifer tarandus platyrhynchus TaxID=3082113 RepID=A0ABN8Y0H8_RANTA|nr:unnamed protein product [Rangifer tarandus platyrhynchus]CAI9692741.1 unnamed protein product [Rangifer tarandus platyrhynchus]